MTIIILAVSRQMFLFLTCTIALDFFHFAAPIRYVLYGEHRKRNGGFVHPVQPDLLQLDTVTVCLQMEVVNKNNISFVIP
jgi:hypothetical protein